MCEYYSYKVTSSEELKFIQKAKQESMETADEALTLIYIQIKHEKNIQNKCMHHFQKNDFFYYYS